MLNNDREGLDFGRSHAKVKSFYLTLEAIGSSYLFIYFEQENDMVDMCFKRIFGSWRTLENR